MNSSAQLARYSLILLTIFVLSIWLPQLWETLFSQRLGKTQLFYSPVSEKFIYTELLGEGHQFIYRDEDGKNYSRQEFEMQIPFIYYKNMEIWGKLPLHLQGRSFDKNAIVAQRQVLELKPIELAKHSARIPVWPLLEANPGRARLSFPEDAFSLHNGQLLFTNTDHNRADKTLSALFNNALKQAGFQFPINAVFGRVSILKAYDAGYLLLDNNGALFHLRRFNASPEVTAIPLPPQLTIRHIKIAESKRQEILALILDPQNRLFLLGDEKSPFGKYSLTEIPLKHYQADQMDLKIIFNPLFLTAVYSDSKTIHATLLDRQGKQALKHFRYNMASGQATLSERIRDTILPWSINLRKAQQRWINLSPRLHASSALIGIGICLLLTWLTLGRRQPILHILPELLIVTCSGLYGLIAVLLFAPEAVANRPPHPYNEQNRQTENKSLIHQPTH